MIQVKMKIDENAEPYKTFAANGFKYEVEVKDTLAMLRNQQTGDMAFIDRNDANLIALIIETGHFSDKAATRATSKPSLEERIKKMVADNDLTLNTLQTINKIIPIPPHGVDLIAPIIGANYYASKNHLISLAEGDVVK